MSGAEDRERSWTALSRGFDVVVIGGGITGSAVARQAVRAGLRVALLEARDFAWGTSSRSTKLVHGGLRYLPQMQLRLVRESVRERQRLRVESPDLVRPLPMVLLSPRAGLARWGTRAAIGTYYALLKRRAPRRLASRDLGWLFPALRCDPGVCGLPYEEAHVDDARLVLRLVREAARAGAVTLNHARVTGLLRERGEVVGVAVEDALCGTKAAVSARAVVNATGVASDRLRAEVEGAPKMRPLRGSHLVFPAWRFPLAAGLSFQHPRDRRWVVALPWEDVTLFGTTDVDHPGAPEEEPSITAGEFTYLIEALQACFPALELRPDDALSTFAGVRPVVSGGFADPSREPRDSWIGLERGLLTVMGGKLTTCRATAHAALAGLRPRIAEVARLARDAPLLDAATATLDGRLSSQVRSRLWGRYGAEAGSVVAAARPGELEPVGDTSTLWAELRWAARAEAPGHLDDLLLRRVRLGLMLPEGGAGVLDRVREICAEELGWNAERWRAEAAAYAALWQTHHSVPGPAAIPR
ncbi:MAG TPA: glycerol-3-phosphate dehydrogenase/oxidase [Myxococcales bacterium]|nr:glycerol-3-phosphate dehydrogenase/oxidase [Myxococcales bacterium]